MDVASASTKMNKGKSFYNTDRLTQVLMVNRPCVHRACQLHPREVSRLQTTSHLAQSAGGDVDVFYSSEEESGSGAEENAVRSIEQERLKEEERVVAERADGQEDDQDSHMSGSYEPEPMLFEMERF